MEQWTSNNNASQATGRSYGALTLFLDIES